MIRNSELREAYAFAMLSRTVSATAARSPPEARKKESPAVSAMLVSAAVANVSPCLGSISAAKSPIKTGISAGIALIGSIATAPSA